MIFKRNLFVQVSDIQSKEYLPISIREIIAANLIILAK